MPTCAMIIDAAIRLPPSAFTPLFAATSNYYADDARNSPSCAIARKQTGSARSAAEQARERVKRQVYASFRFCALYAKIQRCAIRDIHPGSRGKMRWRRCRVIVPEERPIAAPRTVMPRAASDARHFSARRPRQ